MSVYVGIDVHRKRSQVAVIDQDGQVFANRNVNNGVTPILFIAARPLFPLYAFVSVNVNFPSAPTRATAR